MGVLHQCKTFCGDRGGQSVMPKIQYKEINFRGKSLELINLVNQVINEYKNQGYELTLDRLIISWLHVDIYRTMKEVIKI